MTIDKLPSGAYRVRHTEKKKTYSITLPYKPTKKEAFELIQDKINRRVDAVMRFEQAGEKYLASKSNVLSPATLRGYDSILRNIPDSFKALDITEIDDYTLQCLVNDYAVNHSPKSVANYSNLIITVIKMFLPQANLSVSLPQKIHKDIYLPTHDDVKRLFETAKGTEYYIPLYLASLSLRCSEICALTLDDLNENTLTINKALVRGKDGFVLKPTPKNDTSNRTVVIPQEIADIIRKQGYIYNGYPNQINKYLYRTLPKLGIPTFSVHKLRHFFASYSHELGYSDAVIQEMGGWSSSSDVMKRVYRHAMNTDEAKQSIANHFFFS